LRSLFGAGRRIARSQLAELEIGGVTVKTLSARINRFGLVAVGCLALTGSLFAASSASGSSVLLKEVGAITTSKTPSGDLTTQADSYLDQVTQQFSRNQECSRLSLSQSNSADFTVQYFAAFLLDQKFIQFVVINQKGKVLTSQTDHSIPAFVSDACHAIKEQDQGRH
jgi:hypothetical protein